MIGCPLRAATEWERRGGERARAKGRGQGKRARSFRAAECAKEERPKPPTGSDRTGAEGRGTSASEGEGTGDGSGMGNGRQGRKESAPGRGRHPTCQAQRRQERPTDGEQRRKEDASARPFLPCLPFSHAATTSAPLEGKCRFATKSAEVHDQEPNRMAASERNGGLPKGPDTGERAASERSERVIKHSRLSERVPQPLSLPRPSRGMASNPQR